MWSISEHSSELLRFTIYNCPSPDKQSWMICFKVSEAKTQQYTTKYKLCAYILTHIVHDLVMLN